MSERKIRILVAKPGLDGHDRGAKVMASAMRDAGFEVIYTGLHQTPEMIVNAAVQEDVDVVALSILSGAHMTLFPRVLELLRAEGADHVLLTGGGIIPEEDMAALAGMGVGRLFGPGTPTKEPIDYIRQWFASGKRRSGRSGGRAPAGRLRRLVEELDELESRLRLGGGEERIRKQHDAGKLTARERIALLLDPRTPFHEVGLLVAYDQYDGQAPGAPGGDGAGDRGGAGLWWSSPTTPR
jgi:methylmalonyl-CoA mutase, C-terminal domain